MVAMNSESPLVFVSYANPDRKQVDQIVRRIEEAGIKCWTAPRDVPPGSNYAVAILDAIERTQMTVLLLSAHANNSPHVANEIERAVNYRKPIVPVRLADVRPARPIELHISARQWVDMWGTAEGHLEGMRKLLAALQQVLGDRLALPDTVIPGSARAAADPQESDHTELEIIAHDGTSRVLLDPSVLYPSGMGPSQRKDGITVTRGIESSTLKWSQVRSLKLRSRQEQNEKGVTVWRHAVEASLTNGQAVEVELANDWNMAYLGGGGTGLLYGQTDLGDTRIPFSQIALIKVLRFAPPKKM